MVKKIVWLILFESVIWGAAAYSETMDDYLVKNDLKQMYEQKVQEVKTEKIWADRLDDLDESINLIINSPLNQEYKYFYLHDLLKDFPFNTYKDKTEFEPLYAVRYDPSGSIKYLEGLKNRTIAQNFQLMVLWQIYQSEKITTKLYERAAEQCHKDLQDYFRAEKWQSSWREEEYAEKVKDNYEACYADLNCLLEIIPYWRNWDENFDVYIPCEMAQKYGKVVYFDGASGGHGAQSFMISDCALYEKFQFEAELENYVDMLFRESIPESDGSIRFYYQAEAVYTSLVNHYFPRFDLEKQERWDVFPYNEWAVASYYNFRKFNEVLNYGIGYKTALDKLTAYYIQNFGVDREQAYNTALYVLKIPSMDDWKLVTPENLHYLLLTGEKWEKIEDLHQNIENYKKLLEFSVAYPENLREIIEKGKEEAGFDIDYPNWFGKTPLMLAAQYGYLESVKLLLENGADINKQTKDVECWSRYENLCITHNRRSALMYAAQEGQYEVVKYLLEKHADIKLYDSKGMTAYDYMMGTALKYNPHKMMTINGGSAGRYLKDSENKSAFTLEEIEELSPLLQVKI